MDIARDETPLAAVRELRRFAGRQTFHYEPDFCGRMNVVLDRRSPDRVSFLCAAKLAVGVVCTVADDAGSSLRVRITASSAGRHRGTVVEGPESM